MAQPSVAVIARLILKEMKKDSAEYKKILEDIQKKTESMSKNISRATKGSVASLASLRKESKELSKALDQMIPEIALRQMGSLSKEFASLSKGAQINIERFDELVRSGKSLKEAFDGAVVSADSLKRAKQELAEAAKREKEAIKETKEAEKSRVADIASTVAAYTAWAAAIRLVIKAFLDAIASYEELGQEVRRVSLELGISAIEASGWVDVANRAGVSSATFNRAMTQLSRNIVSYRIAQLQGKEETNKFAQAIKAFGIELVKQNGELKSASEVFTELQQKAQEYGPGVVTLGELSNALGFSTRQLVEILFDESLALDEVESKALFLGKTLGELDKERTKELTSSSDDLAAAWQGMSNIISRIFGPALTELKKGLAGLINSVRGVIAWGTALDRTARAIVAGTVKWADANAFMREEMTKLLTGTTAAAEKAAALKRAQDELAQQGIITAGAQDDLNDVLEEQQKIVDKLTDAWDDYLDKQDDINRRFDDQLEDAGIRESRERIKRNLQLTFKLEDIYIKRGRRLRELEFKHVNDIEDVRRNTEKKLLDFERDAARAREKIWVKHRENLIKIENTFNDTVDEAARTNDTVAVVRAIRTRNRQLRDETRRYSVEQGELEKDLAIKRDRINEDAEERKNDLRNRIAEQRAIIERQYRDEIDDLIRKNKRELILSRNKDRERRADIERNRDRALRDAQIYYEREKVALQTHLQELNVIAVLAARGLTQEMVQVAADAMASLAAISAGPIDASPGASIDTGTGTEIIGGVTSTLLEEWRRRRGKSRRRAHGGMDVVNRPTTFVAGEAGAEIAAFIPLSQSRNINHNFGKLPIDFQGLPGGMDTGQVESIVYSAMIELARTLAGSRRS